MPVTTTQFEQLAPVSYSQARPQMRTGDLLLFHSAGLGSDTIEYFTHSLWCHAAFVLVLKEIDRVFILESVDTYGVRMMPLSSKINGMPANPKPYPGQILLARCQGFPSEDTARVGAMTRVALDRLGYPYSPIELARIAERIAAGIVGTRVPGALGETDAYICSEYVAMCYAAMGITLTPDPGGFIAPGDIANDPNVEAVYALTHDLA